MFNNIIIEEIRIAIWLLPPKENVIRQREVAPVRKDGGSDRHHNQGVDIF